MVVGNIRRRAEGPARSARKVLTVLEIVAEAGDGVSAKIVAHRASCTLSSTYELLNTLVDAGYLVNLGHGRGFGLGYRLDGLHRSLFAELHVGSRIQLELDRVHRRARAAAYYAVLRDRDVVVAATADSRAHPRSAANAAVTIAAAWAADGGCGL